MEQISSPASLPATGLELVSAEPTGTESGADFAVILEAGLQAGAPDAAPDLQSAPDTQALPDIEALPADSTAIGITAFIATYSTLPAVDTNASRAAPAQTSDIPLDAGAAVVPRRHNDGPLSKPATAPAVPEAGAPGHDVSGAAVPGLARSEAVRDSGHEDFPRSDDRAAEANTLSGHAPLTAFPASPHPAFHAVTSPARLEVTTPLAAPSWGADFAQQIVWMTTDAQQVAELRLNPPDLGPVEIRLAISAETKNEASVQFISAHASVREAIEAALPRLREMLAEAGMALGQATVSSEFAGGGKSGPDHGSQGNRHGEENSAPGSARVLASAHPLSRRLVDTFA